MRKAYVYSAATREYKFNYSFVYAYFNLGIRNKNNFQEHTIMYQVSFYKKIGNKKWKLGKKPTITFHNNLSESYKKRLHKELIDIIESDLNI